MATVSDNLNTLEAKDRTRNLIAASAVRDVLNTIPVKQIDGTEKNMLPLNSVNYIRRGSSVRISSISSIPSSGLENQAQVDFEIDNVSNSYIKSIYLYLKITNNSGGDVEFFPLYQWFRRIEIINHGGEILETMYPEDQFLLNGKLFTQNQWQAGFSEYLNGGEWYELYRGDVIEDSQFREYAMPIHGLFEPIHLWDEHIHSLRIRFHFDTSTNIYKNGSGATITDMKLEIDSPKISDLEKRAALNRLRSQDTYGRFYDSKVKAIPRTIAAGNTISVNLDGMNGLFNNFGFMIKDQGGVGLNKFDTFRVKEWNIKDKSGNLLVNNPISHVETMFRNLEVQDCQFYKFNKIYNTHWSPKLNLDAKTGSIHGQYFLSGRETLEITFEATETPKIFTLSRNGSAPADAILRIGWPYKGETHWTDWLAFNSNAAALKAAVESLYPFAATGSTVTFSGVLDDATTVTVYGKYNEMTPRYSRPVIQLSSDDGTAIPDCGLDVAISQQYIPGHPNGVTDIDVVLFGTQYSELKISSDGYITKCQ